MPGDKPPESVTVVVLQLVAIDAVLDELDEPPPQATSNTALKVTTTHLS